MNSFFDFCLLAEGAAAEEADPIVAIAVLALLALIFCGICGCNHKS